MCYFKKDEKQQFQRQLRASKKRKQKGGFLKKEDFQIKQKLKERKRREKNKV